MTPFANYNSIFYYSQGRKWLITLIVIIALLIIFLEQQKKTTYQLTLFFSNPVFTQLKHEHRFVLNSLALDEKIQLCLLFLIYGPVKENLKATIPEKTKVEMLHYEKRVLSISFSEEFQSYKDVQNGRILVYSTLLSLFISFPAINEIELYVNHRRLQTILGQYNYSHTFSRKSFLKDAQAFVPELNL